MTKAAQYLQRISTYKIDISTILEREISNLKDFLNHFFSSDMSDIEEVVSQYSYELETKQKHRGLKYNLKSPYAQNQG